MVLADVGVSQRTTGRPTASLRNRVGKGYHRKIKFVPSRYGCTPLRVVTALIFVKVHGMRLSKVHGMHLSTVGKTSAMPPRVHTKQHTAVYAGTAVALLVRIRLQSLLGVVFYLVLLVCKNTLNTEQRPHSGWYRRGEGKGYSTSCRRSTLQPGYVRYWVML